MSSVTALFIATAAGVLLAWAGMDRRHRLQPRSLRSRLVTAGVLLLGINGGLAPMARAATPAPHDKWRIVCIHDARSDGVIVLRLTPVGGLPLELRVPIKAGTFENDIARQVRSVLRTKLPKQLFHVETDDGEAVLVKKQRGTPDFVLEFVSHSVNGLGIRVEID